MKKKKIGVLIGRSSRAGVFCKKGVLRNFTKFTGKHLCQNIFFNKVAGLKPATLLKKRLWHRCFPVNFVKFLRTPFLTEHLWWLLLYRFFTSRCCKFISAFTAVLNIKEKLKEKLKHIHYLLFSSLTPDVFVTEIDIVNVNLTSQISLYL